MEHLVEKSFGVQLRILQICGMYPPSKYKKAYKIYSYFMYCVMMIPIPILGTIYPFLKEDVSLDDLTNDAFLTIQMASLVIKLVPFIQDPEKIKSSICLLENFSAEGSVGKKQEKIIQECISTCRRNFFLYLIFCLSSLITWAIKPFFWEGKQLPFKIWLPLDLTANSKAYLLAYCYVVIGVCSGAFSNGVIDPLIAGLAYHATSQLKVLKTNLKFLSEDADNLVNGFSLHPEEKQALKDRLIYEKIGLCVNHHKAILRFVKNYEDVYSSVVFTQFVASVFVICICCLYLSVVEPFTVIFFSMVIFLFTMLVEIFLYSYYGTTLYEEVAIMIIGDKNNTLTDAIYMGKWYEYEIKSQKNLIILMELSKKPMIITAGKILDLSLMTFMVVLKRAYSLLAVLKNY